MTVTIRNVLQLPSMRGSTLLTDLTGLKKPITAISVLEYSQPTSIQRDLSESVKYIGNELVLTSFASIPSDTEAQCRNIVRSSQRGEAGMVLFYVGILMPQVDPALIETANENNFALIMMPPLDMTIAYSGVISDVMQAIFLDQMINPIFAIDMIEKVAQLPDAVHSVDTVMRMLSDRLQTSIALFDLDYQILKSESWPRGRHEDWNKYVDITQKRTQISDQRLVYWEGAEDGKRLGKLHLLLIAKNELNVYTCSQVAEALQIALNLWGRDFANNNHVALLSAMMEDEPIRMRRLGEYYHLNLSDIHHMWLIPDFQGEGNDVQQAEFAKLSHEFAKIGLCERYHKILFIVPIGDPDPAVWRKWGDALFSKCTKFHLNVPIWCHNVPTADSARRAVHLAQKTADDAVVIFPKKKYLTLGDLNLAKICREHIQAGEQAVNDYLTNQLGLFNTKEQQEWMQTLATFLLDTDQQLSAASKNLFVHPNTVKYRLSKISERFGFPIGKMPETWDLFVLCGMLRLVKKANY
ncbi:PucR family transcriptional regulator [Oenococcus oeni]